MAGDYPRDLVGYGATPPEAKWPGGARIAVNFVINYEEGGENSILHGDEASEAFLSEIVGAVAWPGQRHMNMESLYEYGSRAGFWRLHRIFGERGLPVTVFGIATAMERNPEAVAGMLSAGWEIASHGLKWIEYRNFTEAAEEAHILEATRIHTRLTGAHPHGFYQGRGAVHTLGIVQREGGYLYSADCYNDDVPFWVKGERGPFLMVPYTLDANDMRFATAQGFNSGDQFFTYLKDSFDQLYAEGGRMMSVGLHCRLAGRPGRAAALARFLDYIQRQPGVWVTRRVDIARHWIRTHPPKAGLKPSTLSPALFMELYGDLAEHTPELAANVYETGLGAAQDTAEGLHKVFVAAVHAWPRERQRSFLNAHPDLAGKLHAAKQLTEDSTSEQASAGLDHLTDAELARFLELNAAYRARHGIPFIVAVKGLSKAEIITAFEARIGNDPSAEHAEALRQVERIMLLRLKDRMGA